MIGEAKFIQLISSLSAQLIFRLSKETGMSYAQACNVFYFSDTYRKLANEKTKYWTESAVYIYESLHCELSGLPVYDYI